ncbi:MAG: hypothetical protein EON54_26310 [Alcaligenaceae bacterium]|nr:MAG: hypothetical protein EON54_26310 [Alcaligenaceae bacterium]
MSFAAHYFYSVIKEKPKMKHQLKCLLVAAALGLSGIYANAAPLSDLSAGQTGRIEFNSITPQSIWSYARKNTTDTKSVTLWGDLLMPKSASGKVPAVIYFHGSTGATAAAFDVWAKELNHGGIPMSQWCHSCSQKWALFGINAAC